MPELSKMPDFNGMTPKEIRRAWWRFMADRIDYDTPEVRLVQLAIETLIQNEGSESELWARQYFNRRLAEFKGG